METNFKRSKARIIKNWNQITFRLFIPKTIDKNNKIEVHFNYLDQSTGKNKQIKKANGIDRYATEKVFVRQANDLVDSLINLLGKGWNPITNQMPEFQKLTTNSSIDDCITAWIDLRTSDFEAKTIKQPELDATKMVLNYFQTWLKRNNILFSSPSILTKNDIDQFMRSIEKKRKITQPTYNNYLYKLDYFFKFLIVERVVNFNPANGTYKYKLKGLPTRFKVFEGDELTDVKAKLALRPIFKDLELAINLLYTYRIRGAEQLRIKINMFDFENNLLLLPAQVIENGELVNMTKNGMPAAFRINDEIMQMLKDYIGGDINNKDYFLYGGHCKPKPKQCNKQFFTNKWTDFKIEFDLPDHLKMYALKHTSNSKTLLTTGADNLSIINRHLDNTQINAYTAEMKRKLIIEVDETHKF